MKSGPCVRLCRSVSIPSARCPIASSRSHNPIRPQQRRAGPRRVEPPRGRKHARAPRRQAHTPRPAVARRGGRCCSEAPPCGDLSAERR
eukprot:scaffold2795_cov106-Isochrysis_galbana.AAC.4